MKEHNLNQSGWNTTDIVCKSNLHHGLKENVNTLILTELKFTKQD